ncbi:MAG: phytase [Pseudomonadales bacterium]|nr:phytase [Pseudomonadales bacterium]
MRLLTALLLLATTAGLLPAHGFGADTTVRPRIVSEPVRHDTDDPAIWINRDDPAASLILGTDKDADGALYVFGLDGRVHADKVVRGLLRPNNVDVAYDVLVGGKRVDVAVLTERFASRLRIFRLPDMAPIDGGGIPVFVGERARDPMGIALYTRPADGALFAIVSRSDAFAPREGYLHQYRLADDGTGQLRGLFTRAFASWSGLKEIEALAVDDALGYVYASDESWGVRKYHADPLAEDAEEQLAEFGTGDLFARDHEGIAIYRRDDGTGYILVSDQQADLFRIFTREGAADDPHRHELVGTVRLSTRDSDGSDVIAQSLPGFPGGLFVAMSTDRTFQFYAWEDIRRAAGLPR